MPKDILEQIVSTIERNEYRRFDTLIGQIADVNAQNIGEDNQTLLMLAAYYGATNIGKALIKLGALPDVTDSGGVTAIIFASAAGNLEMVKLILEAGGTVNLLSRTELSISPLMAAAMNGELEIVKLLITNTASVNLQNEDGITALLLATLSGHLETVRYLIKVGASINLVATDGRTALFSALQLPDDEPDREEIIDLLLEAGADVTTMPQAVQGYAWAKKKLN